MNASDRSLLIGQTIIVVALLTASCVYDDTRDTSTALLAGGGLALAALIGCRAFFADGMAREQRWRLWKPPSLGRNTRIAIAISAFWCAYVVFRTSGYYEIFGFEMDAWDDDALFANLLIPPAILIVGRGVLSWVRRAPQ